MSEVKRIRLEDTTVEYIQMLAYEADGLRVLNCQILKSGGANTAQYRQFQTDYLERYKEYQVALQEVMREAAPEYTGPQWTFNINYLSGELIVSTKEGQA